MSRSHETPASFAAALATGGVEFVTAFPGSPTTTLAMYLDAHGPAHGIEFRWAINENVALSQAFGAAMGGRGAAAMMKHVGVNVASDALHVMGVVHGLAAPLLLVEGADAKPGSSQSAQDNRWLYASSPQLLVLGPSAGTELGPCIADACAISAGAGMLVVVRGEARCFGAREAGERAPGAASPPASPYAAWPRRGFALATSARTYEFHLRQRASVLARLGPWVEASWRGSAALELDGELETAVVIAAHLGASAAARARAHGLPHLRVLTEHPLPEASLLALARRCATLAVLEECTPTLERELAALVHRAGLGARVIGRRELGDPRPIGRLDDATLDRLLAPLAPDSPTERSEHRPPRVDPGPLLDGLAAQLEAERLAHDQAQPASGFPDHDPRRQLFAALRGLAAEVFITVDPGVTGVLALADHQADVKMHMGGAVPIAAGWSRARVGAEGRRSLAVAVVGDTNLPHSEWLGILDALDHHDELLIVVADNGSSEMTQRIVTPRLAPKVAVASLEAAGLRCWMTRVGDGDSWRETLAEAAAVSGPRLVWLHL